MLIPLWYYIVTGIINSLTALSLCVILFLKWHQSVAIRRFSLFCLSVFFWSLFYVAFLQSQEYSKAELYVRICMIGVFFMPTTFLAFVFVLLKRKDKKHKFINKCNVFLSLCFTSLVWSRFYIIGMGQHLVFSYWPKPGIMFHLVLIHFCLVFLYSFLLLFRKFTKSNGIVRNQYVYILIGIILGVVGGSTNYLCWYRFNFPPVLNIFVSFYLLIIVYAIIRYNLLDIRFVISCVGVFVGVYIPILLIPIVAVFLQRSFLERIVGIHYWIIPTVLEGVLAVVGLLLYFRVKDSTEKRLLKKEYNYRKLILNLSSEIVHIHDLDTLSKRVVECGIVGVEAELVSVYLLDQKRKTYFLKSLDGNIVQEKTLLNDDVLIKDLCKRKSVLVKSELQQMGMNILINKMKEISGEVIIPCLGKELLLGVIVLGSKRNKRMYTQVEIDAFQILGNQMALALENIMFLEEQKMMQLELFSLKRMADVGYLARAVGHHIQNGLQVLSNIVFAMMMNESYERNLKEEKEVFQNHSDDLNQLLYYIEDTSKVAIALRDLSHSNSDTEKQSLQIEDVVKKALALGALRSVHFSKIKITMDVDKDIPKIMGNFAQLQDVFFNMINNSYDAIMFEENIRKGAKNEYQGKMQIKISKGINSVVVSIVDNGKGMSADVKERMFIPMFTTKATADMREERDKKEGVDQTGGMGMGMYTVYMVIKSHNGDIQVPWTKEHEGTQIAVILPIAS